MAMTTPAIYNTSVVGAGGGATNPMQRSTLSRTSFSLGANSMTTNSQRKSAVELLAETKAFYVKSETVRGRTQTLPLLSHNRNRPQRFSNPQTTERFTLSTCHTSLDMTTRPSGIATLNRRSTGGSSGTLSHQSNADMLQNALRKLLDCSSPITSLENVNNSNSVSTDLNYDIDCTTPISPPAEYAFCGTASERRYTTRSLSQSQPVSASSTRSGGTSSHIPENSCCSAHLVVLAKSLPDLHTARNLSSSYEGSRSNKSTTSDVFSLNRDSGGDSSGHLTHRSEPAPQHRSVTSSHATPGDKQWPGGATLATSDLRRDSGSSTQHSGSYYHNSPYYDCKHVGNFIISSSGRSYEVHKNFENKNTYNAHFPSQDIPKPATGGGYSPSSFHEHDVYNRIPNAGFYCRVSKHGYPVPMSMARTEIVQSSNDQRTVTQNVRNYDKVRDNKKVHSSSKKSHEHSSGGHSTKLRPVPLVYDSASSGELILPPPIECCDNFHVDNSTFIDTIIPPPVFEVENEIYESLEIKNLDQNTSNETCCGYNDNYKPPNSGDLKILECIRGHSHHDNISDISFHENVAPTMAQKVGGYSPRKDTTTTTTVGLLPVPMSMPLDGNDLPGILSPPPPLPDDETGPMSLPFVDPELSPGPGTFKRQKGFRFKNKTAVGTNGRAILRSKSDISDRYRRNNSKQNQTGSVVRKSSGGEISRSVSHLEQFFEQLGLNSDAYDNLFVKSGSSDTESPVYFSDVSTVDSNRPVSQVDNNEGCTVAAPATLAPILRSSEPTSIVERNARIIKWMCNCRKAQLAGASQSYKQ